MLINSTGSAKRSIFKGISILRHSNRNVRLNLPILSRQYCSDGAKSVKKRYKRLSDGPDLKEFLIAGKNLPIKKENNDTFIPYLDDIDVNGNGRKVFFEVYGCQMNVNDTEVVWSILKNNGYLKADKIDQADVVLLITCAIREKAESKVS